MCRHSSENFTRAAAVQVLGLVYWGWLPMHFLLIHRLHGGFGAIVLLCTLIALNDNGAYYTGKLLGKNSAKFLPGISPGKTWTGFLGGALVTIVMALVFGYTVPGLHAWQRALLGLIVAMMAPIGDLLESAMKRDAGVKDSGFLIPGHGGVMDRFDSWAFAAPLFYYFLRVYAWV
jgi:phosphatidate cytidylyltransferase